MTAQAARGGRTAAARRGAAGAKARADAPFAPLSFGKRDRLQEAQRDRVVLFEIDGTEYTIPAVVPAGDSVAYQLVAGALPTEPAKGAYLIRELAGPAALTALLGDADVTDGDLRALFTIVSNHVFGPMEAPGN